MNVKNDIQGRRLGRPRNHPKLDVVFSEEDSDLHRFSWLDNRYGYAVRVTTHDHKTKHHAAHREVMARVVGRTLLKTELVDHINFNRVDNRRENLRIVTAAQNTQRRDINNTKYPGFRGVTFKPTLRKWQATVWFNGKAHYCGLYETAEAANDAARGQRIRFGFFGESESVA